MITETNNKLDELLNSLMTAVLASRYSRKKVIDALNALLTWLNIPENNVDSNCRKIDNFISNKIIFEPEYEKLPEDIREVIFDIGATLGDTYTSPKIAKNFDSTPRQLLNRVLKLI